MTDVLTVALPKDGLVSRGVLTAARPKGGWVPTERDVLMGVVQTKVD